MCCLVRQQLLLHFLKAIQAVMVSLCLPGSLSMLWMVMGGWIGDWVKFAAFEKEASLLNDG